MNRKAPVFVALLALLGILGLVGSAQATEIALPSPFEPTAATSEEADWEFEEDCVEGEAESGEEAEGACEEEDEESEASGAETCPVRSASAHASTKPHTLKVTIGYTTNEPVTAKIQIQSLGTYERHLGKSGVLRFTEKLGSAHRRRFVVDIDPIGWAGCPSRRLVLFRH